MKTLIYIHLGVSALSFILYLFVGIGIKHTFKRRHPDLKFPKSHPIDKVGAVFRSVLIHLIPIYNILLFFMYLFCEEKIEERTIDKLYLKASNNTESVKTYEIWYGKDPEELVYMYCWPDTAAYTDEFKNKYVAQVLSTHNEKDFWNEFIKANIDPPAMWYWVIIDGVTHISGAIDPDDIYCPCVPQWVKDNVIRLRNAGSKEAKE